MGATRIRRGDVLALALLCTAQFMLVLDVVVVNVALPSIRADLQVPDGALPFVAVAYTVSFGSLLVAFGRVGDRYGRRRVFLVGLTVFTLASLTAGLARTGWQLIASRGLQGIGAAMVSPTALALLTTRFEEGPARNRALSSWGAVGAGGAIAGQLIGGVLAEAAGWRAVFLVNVPVGVLAVAAAAALLSEHREHRGAPLDGVAAALLSGGLVPAVLAVTWLPQRGFSPAVVVALSTAVLLLAAFGLRQRRSSAPLIEPGLLRRPGVRTGIAAAVTATSAAADLVPGYRAGFLGAAVLVVVAALAATRLPVGVGRAGAVTEADPVRAASGRGADAAPPVAPPPSGSRRRWDRPAGPGAAHRRRAVQVREGDLTRRTGS